MKIYLYMLMKNYWSQPVYILPVKQLKFREKYNLVNIGYRYFYPEDNILEVSEIYFKMRTTLTNSELLLVRALDFNLEVELPFTFCLTVLRNMGSIPFFNSLSDTSSASSPYINGTTNISFQKIWKQMEQDMPINFNSIARVAWMFVWDSLCCPKLSLKYSIAEVGLGCLYLALRTSYADLQMTMTDWVDMWGASNNISVQTVRDVVMDLIELYEQSGLSNSNNGGDSTLKA
ncbi:unnamed protein product [Cunninghamella echinulata]